MILLAGVLPGVLAADESYEAGPTGLLIIVLLGVAIYFLGRSMVKHIRRVPESFDRPAGDPSVPGSRADADADRPDVDGVDDSQHT